VKGGQARELKTLFILATFLKLRMATHPVGKDTVNVAVNLLKHERSLLRQLALDEGRSLSTFIRRQVMTGLRITNPTAVIEMEKARKQHHEQA